MLAKVLLLLPLPSLATGPRRFRLGALVLTLIEIVDDDTPLCIVPAASEVDPPKVDDTIEHDTSTIGEASCFSISSPSIHAITSEFDALWSLPCASVLDENFCLDSSFAPGTEFVGNTNGRPTVSVDSNVTGTCVAKVTFDQEVQQMRDKLKATLRSLKEMEQT